MKQNTGCTVYSKNNHLSSDEYIPGMTTLQSMNYCFILPNQKLLQVFVVTHPHAIAYGNTKTFTMKNNGFVTCPECITST